MPLPVGSYGAGAYGAGAYGFGAGPPPPPPPGPAVSPGHLPFADPQTLRELWINAIVALGTSFATANAAETLDELMTLFAQSLLNFQLSVTLPLYVVGPGQGMVNDSGPTDNTPIINQAFATARSLGYGGLHLLPGYIPNGWYGMDVDIPDGMGIFGVGGGGDMTNPGTTNPSPAYAGTVIGPSNNIKGVAPLRLSGAGSFADNLLCVGSGPGHTTGTFPTQSWLPNANGAPTVGYALLVNGHGARATRINCIGGAVAALGFDTIAAAIINATLFDITALNPFPLLGYQNLSDRADACTWVTHAPTITDPHIAATDAYSPIVGFPGTAQCYVAPGPTLLPGVSFTAIDATGTTVAPTTGTSGTLSIKQFRGGGFYLNGTDVILGAIRVYAGGTYIEGPDAHFSSPRFFPSGQTVDVVANSTGRISFSSPTFDFGAATPVCAIERRGPCAIELTAPTLEVTSTGPTLAAFHDANPTTGLAAFSIHDTTINGAGTIASLLDMTGGYPAGNILDGTNVPAASLTTLFTNGTPSIVRSNLIGGVFQPEIPTAASVTALPIGAVVPYGGSTVPSGFLACNGAAVSRTTYATLFATIGTAFGPGDGSTTFNVPNMASAYPKGTGTDALGTRAGANTRLLAAANIPLISANTNSGSQVHQHTIPGSQFVIGLTGAGGYFINTPGGTPGVNTVSFTVGTNTDNTGHAHSFSVGAASPTAYSSEPLFVALSYIIRAS